MRSLLVTLATALSLAAAAPAFAGGTTITISATGNSSTTPPIVVVISPNGTATVAGSSTTVNVQQILASLPPGQARQVQNAISSGGGGTVNVSPAVFGLISSYFGF